MIVLTFLAVAYCAFVGTLLVRRGLRNWRRGARPSGPGSILLTDGTKAGFERAAIVFGAFHYLLGVLIGLVGLLDASGVFGGMHPRPSEAVGVALLILLIGVVGSAWTGIAITWFNRPKFLVPPSLRDQPGSMSARQHGPHATWLRGIKGRRMT